MSIERADPTHKGFTTKGSIFKKHLEDRYSFCNSYIINKDVLDIPCGLGWGTSMLKYYKSLYAIDNSKNAIMFGSKKYLNITFIVGDMVNIPINKNKLDVVICLEGYEHISQYDQPIFLNNIKRILKDDGIFIASIPLAKPNGIMSGNKYHLHEPTLKEVKTIFALFFSDIYSNINKISNIDILSYVGMKK